MLKSLFQCLKYKHQPRALLARGLISTTAHAVVSYYDILGVQGSATAEEIKNAFRQRVKELHPDLNAAYTAADGEAFLQLVKAYEVLSDPKQRQLYDVASSSQLPGALRRAAAAAAAGGADSKTASDDRSAVDPFGWRYGLSDWARYGPEDVPAVPDDGTRLRSLLSALAKHRTDLEHDLHAGLLRAFLGPKLEVLPGQLPPSFEADERAHPSLSQDLLHLVHGRVLLGVVRVQQPLQIAGDAAAAAAALPDAATLQLTRTEAIPPGVLATDIMAPTGAAGIAKDANSTDIGAPAGAAAPHSDLHTSGGMFKQGCLAAAALAATQEASSNVAATAASAAAAPHHGYHVDSDTTEHEQEAAVEAHVQNGAEIEESRWQELLQQQHPLRGMYDWLPPPPLQLTAESQAAAPPHDIGNLDSTQRAHTSHAGDAGTGGGGTASAGSPSGMLPAQDSFTLGGQAVKQAWEDAWQRQHGCCHGVDDTGLWGSNQPHQNVAELATSATVPSRRGPAEASPTVTSNGSSGGSSSSMKPSRARPVCGVSIHCSSGVGASVAAAEHSTPLDRESQQAEQKPKQSQQQQELQPLNQQQEDDKTAETCGGHHELQQSHHSRQQQHCMGRSPSLKQQHSNRRCHHQQKGGTDADTCSNCNEPQQLQRGQQQQQSTAGPQQQHSRQQQQQQQRYKQQAHWLRHRRLWRWVQSPTSDWSAADWEFDDSSEGVAVLQLLLAGGKVAAVAVRDNKQAAKPIKVYIDGMFTVAILDDIAMEPLTGRLMGVLYKYYTPGVHHLYFYLPGTQGSRVLARLQRRWMPPSSTWLFPPVSESHDCGGWVVEWEGHTADNKPGWMHPAVFVLTAASYSFDMEVKRMQGSSRAVQQEQLGQQFRDLGRRLAQAFQSLEAKLRGQTW